jgi:WD40 repeat protein
MCGKLHLCGWLPAVAALVTAPAQMVRAQERERGEEAGHGKAAICCLAFAPNGRFFVVGRDDGIVRLRDVDAERWKVVREGHRGAIAAVAFDGSASNFAWACSEEAAIEVWSTSARDPIRCVHYGVRTLALSPDGRLAVSGGSDQAVRFWELPAGRLLPSTSPHKAEVTSVAFARNGKIVISGAADGSVWLWDIAPPRPRRALASGRTAVNSVAISADGATAWAGGQDGMVRGWDVATGELRTQLSAGAAVDSLALSVDGRLAAGTAAGTIRLWEARMGAECATLRGHTRAVATLAYSPDGKTLASGGRDGEARLWHVPSSK